ncbi:hypothetical protein O1611_g10467 [Lasiodiplodia mahajangana]|uniref:Uncharacterized protein n=1 Tax=Lasiodiplodia mahajangana TaxID=1108764 RepID=A0ACC2IYJ6_9PEZI|nr:hypothetical protein O1611_g10467 [Lasiodiplodia mahajangana]
MYKFSLITLSDRLINYGNVLLTRPDRANLSKAASHEAPSKGKESSNHSCRRQELRNKINKRLKAIHKRHMPTIPDNLQANNGSILTFLTPDARLNTAPELLHRLKQPDIFLADKQKRPVNMAPRTLRKGPKIKARAS